jgi:hypothetical protein
MTTVSSPQAAPRGIQRVYDLRDEYAGRDALREAVQAQNRLCNKYCSVARNPPVLPEGYAGAASAVVYKCLSPTCSFLLCAKRKRSKIDPDADGRIKIMRHDSVLQHDYLCMSHPPKPACKELLNNELFVEQAKHLKTHTGINEVVERFYGTTISTTTSSHLRMEFALRTHTTGFSEGFSWVRDLMEHFAVRNPGTYYDVTLNEQGEFESLIFVPPQSFDIVKYSAVSYYCLDSGHSLCKHWKTKVFIFEITDGNNQIMPIAMGLFPSESSPNLTRFMKAIMGINGGALGELINRTTSVICTDRAKCMRPIMQALLPLAQHRHDAWHILKNIHDNGFKSEMGYLLECQRATTGELFIKAMDNWREVYPEAAAFNTEKAMGELAQVPNRETRSTLIGVVVGIQQLLANAARIMYGN